MMDPNIGWIQQEFEGPALEFWKKCWKDFNQKDDKSSTNPTLIYLKDNPSSTHDLDNNQDLISKYNGTPWIKPKDSHYEGINGLHQEIEDFYDYIKPKVREQQIRNEVLNRITRVIENIWPNTLVKVNCFGSFKTGTYLPTSDIDLVVINHQWPYLPLIEMEDYLIRSGQCHPTQIRVLDRATVPIIKMIDYCSGIRINISFNMPQVVKSVDLVNEYLKEFPNAIKLLLLIKQFVLQRDLNEVFKGGLSSYSLLLMVIHFFKTNPDTHTDIGFHSKPGHLLMRFLELYGRKLNYELVGLNVKDGIYCKKSELFVNMENGKESRHPPPLLWIEDPLDATNNVSKNSYKVNQIRDAFSYAFDILNTAVGPNQMIVQKTNSILGRIVRITDEVIDKRRALLNNYRGLNRTVPYGNAYHRTDQYPYKQNRGGNRGFRGNRGNKNQLNYVQSNETFIQKDNRQHTQHNGFPFFENSQQRNQKFDNRNRNGIKRNNGHINGQNGHWHSPHFQKFTNSYHPSPNNVCYYSFDRNANQQKERALQLTGNEFNKIPVIGLSDDKSVPNGSTDKQLNTIPNHRLRSNTCD